jgi:hypothetical protein
MQKKKEQSKIEENNSETRLKSHTAEPNQVQMGIPAQTKPQRLWPKEDTCSGEEAAVVDEESLTI